MPIYDFKCQKCKKVDKDVFLQRWNDLHYCDKCKIKMEKVPSLMIPSVFPSDGIFLEHVSPEGKRFYSKQEMRDYAKAHDLEIGYLE